MTKITQSEIDADFARLVGDFSTEGESGDDGDTITTDQLADLIGLGVNQTLALARANRIPRLRKGRFNRRDAVRAYIAYIKQNPVGRGASSPALTLAKTRTAEAQAEKLETANAIARREFVAAADVEREWASVLRDVRAAMLALPSRVQQRLAHLTIHDITTIDREIRDALVEIAHVD